MGIDSERLAPSTQAPCRIESRCETTRTYDSDVRPGPCPAPSDSCGPRRLQVPARDPGPADVARAKLRRQPGPGPFWVGRHAPRNAAMLARRRRRARRCRRRRLAYGAAFAPDFKPAVAPGCQPAFAEGRNVPVRRSPAQHESGPQRGPGSNPTRHGLGCRVGFERAASCPVTATPRPRKAGKAIALNRL